MPSLSAVDGELLLAGECLGEFFVGNDSLPGVKENRSVICRIDPDGHLNWVKTMGGASYSAARQAVADKAGNIYLLGFFGGNSPELDGIHLPPGQGNSYLALLRETPEFTWARRAGPSGLDSYGSEVATDLAGNKYVAGSFIGTEANFGDITISNPDGLAGFLAKYDSSGHTL